MSILGLTWALGFSFFAQVRFFFPNQFQEVMKLWCEKLAYKQIILLILQGSEWLAVLFTILNSSQGVWILVFHILLNKKAVKEVTLHGRHMTTRFKVRNFENGLAVFLNLSFPPLFQQILGSFKFWRRPVLHNLRKATVYSPTAYIWFFY